ncbi:MAG: hypothetical protein Sapg2KO_00930 [Saprospiraceae bacterium]
MKRKEKTVGFIGLSAVLLLATALLTFGALNKDFSFLNDFISKLGAKGQPNALWFNLIGFMTVGILLFIFGFSYGKLLKDKLLALLLSLFGVGFAFTAIPADMALLEATASKAHTLAICLGLASWLFGLSRLGFNKQLHQKIRNRANVTAVLLILAILAFVLGIWSMPITHRLVFGIVFGWTTITSLDLIYKTGGQISPSEPVPTLRR